MALAFRGMVYALPADGWQPHSVSAADGRAQINPDFFLSGAIKRALTFTSETFP